MKGRNKNNNKMPLGWIVALLGVVAALIAVISLAGIENNLVYYWSATELKLNGAKAQGAVVRLGGVVRSQSVRWNAKTLDLRFKVGDAADGDVPTVEVHAHGAPPQMFREGIGAVVEGRLEGDVFEAHRVMVKHSNEYRPPTEDSDLQDQAATTLGS